MNKILVIDHDAASRATLAATLEQQGFEVLQAATGVQGVQTARTESPNLILCDVDLQGLAHLVNGDVPGTRSRSSRSG